MYRFCADCFYVDPSEIDGSVVPPCKRCKSGHLVVLCSSAYQAYLELLQIAVLNCAVDSKWRVNIESRNLEFNERLQAIARMEGNHEISV
jgi:hypothetical protein